MTTNGQNVEHTPPSVLRLATRGSALALEQTAIVDRLLREQHPGLMTELVTVTTTGDANQSAPVTQLGDGAFVRGVEAALIQGRADVAVHSAKDVPTTEPAGLTLAAFPKRADARDVIVSRDGRRFTELPSGARLGTSSPRRAAIARSLRPDIEVLPIRGNVDTRLRKLHAGEYDALVLAAAGLTRLGRGAEATEYCDPLVWVPAPGQGILAIQCRSGDPAAQILTAIDHASTHAAIAAERAVLRRLGSGCRTPVGAHARIEDDTLILNAVLVSPDGRRTVIAQQAGSPNDAGQIGTALADDLIRRGADIYQLAG
ncbi:MAG: hydroxymethylbilane synthase [Dehalococcoidia bacterium]